MRILFLLTGKGRHTRKLKLHASLTASESSTVAEEIVVLLRRLHPLPAWNKLINTYISVNLQAIPKLIMSAEGMFFSHSRDQKSLERQVSFNRIHKFC